MLTKSKSIDLAANTTSKNSKIPFPDKKRLDLMQAGALDLINWLNDQMKNGLASLPTFGYEFWETISKRMVDSKLSGLSNRIWTINSLIEAEGEWEDQVLKEFSELYLLCRALTNLNKFSKEQQLDFLNVSGFNITKKHLEHSNTIEDEWRILSVVENSDSKMKSRRTWIQGTQSKFMGLLLEYAWGKQDFMVKWVAGKKFKGDLKVYPSEYPLRVKVSNYTHLNTEIKSFAAYPNLDSFLKAYAVAISAKPFIGTFPICLKDISIHAKGQEVYLVDNEKKYLECKCHPESKWGLLAISAGLPIRLFATWDGHILDPHGAIINNRYISLKSS